MTAKKNGNEAGAADDAQEAPAEAEAPRLSIFDQARNANLRNAAEAQAAQAGGERRAGREQTEHEATPYSLSHHPDGTEKRMVICRPDGGGEREVTVAEWDRMQANPHLPVGAWMVKFTEVIAPHHSDEMF